MGILRTINEMKQRIRQLEKIIEKDCIHIWTNDDVKNIKCIRCNKPITYYDIRHAGTINKPSINENK